METTRIIGGIAFVAAFSLQACSRFWIAGCAPAFPSPDQKPRSYPVPIPLECSISCAMASLRSSRSLTNC